jgi:hypothetical protein
VEKNNPNVKYMLPKYIRARGAGGWGINCYYLFVDKCLLFQGSLHKTKTFSFKYNVSYIKVNIY